MWYLYATQEEMILAKCELVCLTNLVSFFTINPSYSKLMNEVFHELSKFHQQFKNKMASLDLFFEENQNLFVQGKEIEMLEHIYRDCKKTRDCFHELLRPFLSEPDKIAKDKLATMETHIQHTIKLAEENIKLMEKEKAKSDLKQDLDSLKLNTQSLLVPLNKMRHSINQLSITHEKIDMTLAILQRSLTQIENFYSTELTNLHSQIINKLNFSFSKKQYELFCTKTYLLNSSNILRNNLNLSLWSNVPETKTQQTDIETVVQFVTQHISFFYAPFNYKTERLFTQWGNANARELSEVSNGLRKHLCSKNAIEVYSEALFALKEGDDAEYLIKILRQNNGLLSFLKDCADFPYPIIGRWNPRREFDPATDEWDPYHYVYK